MLDVKDTFGHIGKIFKRQAMRNQNIFNIFIFVRDVNSTLIDCFYYTFYCFSFNIVFHFRH